MVKCISYFDEMMYENHNATLLAREDDSRWWEKIFVLYTKDIIRVEV